MRDLLISGLVLMALPLALRHVYVGVLLWTWISVMVPHKLAYGFAYNAPFAAVAAAVTLLGLMTTRDRVRPQFPAPIVFCMLFLVWTAITTAFAIYPRDSLPDLSQFFKIQLMSFVAAAVLCNMVQLRLFVWINVLSLGFYGIKGGIYTLLTGGGGRVWGPPGGFIEGNNELALALIVMIPMANYLRLTTPYKFVRHGLFFTMVLTAIAAMGSQSRGALLAIGAMSVVLWWRSPRKALGVFVLVGAVVGIAAFMPSSWHDRMESISSYRMDGSAMGRIHAWETAVNIANDRPLGAGFSMYSPSVFNIYAPYHSDSMFDSTIARAAHSIYFQVLGEHGYVGLFLFVMIWMTTWFVASGLRSPPNGRSPDPGIFHLGGMAQVSLVGYLVGGAFLSLAYYDLPYNILIAIVVARRVSVDVADGGTDIARAQPTDRGFWKRLGYWVRTA